MLKYPHQHAPNAGGTAPLMRRQKEAMKMEKRIVVIFQDYFSERQITLSESQASVLDGRGEPRGSDPEYEAYFFKVKSVSPEIENQALMKEIGL